MLPTGGECVYIVEREGKANLIRHTTDRRGEERESSWWRERGDLLLFYDGYGDGPSWRREEERDSCASELLLLQSARPREMRH
jgi:hypothetical protein